MFIPVLMHGFVGVAAPWLLPITIGGGVASHYTRRHRRDDEMGYLPSREDSVVYRNWDTQDTRDEGRTFSIR